MKNLLIYIKAWRLYFMMRKTRRWKSDDPIKSQLIKGLTITSIYTYDILKEKYGRLLPKNPMV